jgi:hypothetical protein
MIYLEAEIPEDVGYLIPIGDLHLGDKAFSKRSLEKLKGYVKWVKERSNARVILMGDIFNTATRVSKTSPFEQTEDEEEWAYKLFSPIKDKIICVIDGNHEWRLIDFANYSILNSFAKRLGIKYAGISAVVNFKINKRKRGTIGGVWREQYLIYAHHTRGGGALVGSKMNRVDKLRIMVANADVYLGAHNHQLGVMPVSVGIIDVRHKRVNYPKQWLVDCGSYLDWENSYAEKDQMPPVKLGSPRIRFDSLKHDCHISL